MSRIPLTHKETENKCVPQKNDWGASIVKEVLSSGGKQINNTWNNDCCHPEPPAANEAILMSVTPVTENGEIIVSILNELATDFAGFQMDVVDGLGQPVGIGVVENPETLVGQFGINVIANSETGK